MKMNKLPRIILGVAGAATIALAGFSAGNATGYATGAKNATANYEEGYAAGYEAATEENTVDGWKLDSITAPDGTEVLTVDSIATGNGYTVYIATENSLELMTTATPEP